MLNTMMENKNTHKFCYYLSKVVFSLPIIVVNMVKLLVLLFIMKLIAQIHIFGFFSIFQFFQFSQFQYFNLWEFAIFVIRWAPAINSKHISYFFEVFLFPKIISLKSQIIMHIVYSLFGIKGAPMRIWTFANISIFIWK